MEREWIVLGVLTFERSVVKLSNSTILGVLTTVESQVTKAEDDFWVGGKPEVDQVKMMDRLRQQEAAAVDLLTVPPIVSASESGGAHAKHGLTCGRSPHRGEYPATIRNAPE